MVGMTEHGLVNCLFNRGTITSKFSFGKNRGDKKANSEKQSHFSMVYLMFGKQTIPRNALKHREFLLLHLYYKKNISVACSSHSPKSHPLAGQIILSGREQETKALPLLCITN